MSANPLLWAQKPRLFTHRVWLVPLAASLALYGIFNLNHLVCHILLELFTVFLSLLVFFLIWGTYRFGRDEYLMFVTGGYFWVAVMDLFHTLFFPGMRILDGHGGDGNHSIQSWVTARLLEAVVMLVAPLLMTKRYGKLQVMGVIACVAIGSHAMIMADWYPDAFRVGHGVTTFKIAAEYVVIGTLLTAMTLTAMLRSRFSSKIWVWMIAAMAVTALSEVFFIYYENPADLALFMGHALKLFSYWLLFIGVWEVAIELPYLRSQLLSAAVEQSPAVVMITDRHANIEYVNNAFKTVTGYSRQEALGKNPRFLTDGTTPPDNYMDMWATLRAGGVWRGFFDNRRKNGNPYTEHATISSITDESGRISHYVATKEDVTTLRRAEEYLIDNESTLNKTLLGAITAVSELLEARDPYTAGHSKRVSDLAVKIATELDVPAARIEGLRIAALIHDIGKIKIPMEILSKPGRLSNEEFALVKHHSEVGYQAIRHIPFPMNIPDIVRAHHEKWDGSGYPQGLAGDDIPFEAQILCVADVIESITSHRPYREALGINVALEVIREGRGTHFSPVVVDAAFRLRSKGLV